MDLLIDITSGVTATHATQCAYQRGALGSTLAVGCFVTAFAVRTVLHVPKDFRDQLHEKIDAKVSEILDGVASYVPVKWIAETVIKNYMKRALMTGVKGATTLLWIDRIVAVATNKLGIHVAVPVVLHYVSHLKWISHSFLKAPLHWVRSASLGYQVGDLTVRAVSWKSGKGAIPVVQQVLSNTWKPALGLLGLTVLRNLSVKLR